MSLYLYTRTPLCTCVCVCVYVIQMEIVMTNVAQMTLLGFLSMAHLPSCLSTLRKQSQSKLLDKLKCFQFSVPNRRGDQVAGSGGVTHNPPSIADFFVLTQ